MERTGTLGRPKLGSLLHSNSTMLSSNKFDSDNYNTDNNQSQNSNDNLEYSRRPSLSSAATSPGNYESTVGSSPYNVMSLWNQSSPMNESPWLTLRPSLISSRVFHGLTVSQARLYEKKVTYILQRCSQICCTQVQTARTYVFGRT